MIWERKAAGVLARIVWWKVRGTCTLIIGKQKCNPKIKKTPASPQKYLNRKKNSKHLTEFISLIIFRDNSIKLA